MFASFNVRGEKARHREIMRQTDRQTDRQTNGVKTGDKKTRRQKGN